MIQAIWVELLESNDPLKLPKSTSMSHHLGPHPTHYHIRQEGKVKLRVKWNCVFMRVRGRDIKGPGWHTSVASTSSGCIQPSSIQFLLEELSYIIPTTTVCLLPLSSPPSSPETLLYTFLRVASTATRRKHANHPRGPDSPQRCC